VVSTGRGSGSSGAAHAASGTDEDAVHPHLAIVTATALEQAGDHPLSPQQRAVVDINDPAIQAEIRRQVPLALLSISEPKAVKVRGW
jgi:hypothetical protein